MGFFASFTEGQKIFFLLVALISLGFYDKHVRKFMTHQPVTVFEDIKLEEALQLMEDRTHPLNVLPVLKKDGCLYGLFRLHDAYDH